MIYYRIERLCLPLHSHRLPLPRMIYYRIERATSVASCEEETSVGWSTIELKDITRKRRTHRQQRMIYYRIESLQICVWGTRCTRNPMIYYRIERLYSHRTEHYLYQCWWSTIELKEKNTDTKRGRSYYRMIYYRIERSRSRPTNTPAKTTRWSTIELKEMYRAGVSMRQIARGWSTIELKVLFKGWGFCAGDHRGDDLL
mgnify:CR=1 FL=1